MHWFTTAWHTGGLTDEQHEAALEDYRHHLTALRRVLRQDALRLLELDLHDGRVSDWYLASGVLTLTLTIGGRHRDHETATIIYSDATLEGFPSMDGADLVSVELERAGDGRLEQRFWFWGGSEFSVRFSEVETVTSPV